MKFAYLLLAVSVLIQCTNSKTQETSKADSIFLDSASVSYAEDGDDEVPFTEVPDEPEGDSLALAISNAVDSVSSVWSENIADYYSISSTFNGYENGWEATWYFDKSLKLKYYTGSWSSEGTEGKYSYYFDADEDLVAASTEDDYQEGYETTTLYTGFKPVYGFSKSATSEVEEAITYNYESAYNTMNSEAKSQYSKLINYIQANADSATFNGDEVNIHIESTSNYGFDFTSKEDYSISRKLFDKLIKN